MNFKIVKLSKFSGSMAGVYSVVLNRDNETLLNQFVRENMASFKSETKNILERLISIGHKTGARSIFFKEWEGEPGDGVCALYDKPNNNLRLYCICYGTQLIIIGSGGHKPKSICALQEDPKLKEENALIKEISKEITKRIKDKDIRFTQDYLDFTGDLEFNDED